MKEKRKINSTQEPSQFKKIFFLICKLFRNAATILFTFNILLFLLYLVGNYQIFLDKSQSIILNVMSITSIIMVIFAVTAFLMSIVIIFIDRFTILRLFKIFFLLIISSSGTIFIVYSVVLNKLSGGI
ncbi:MAG: hypothetical protein IKX23_02575 [Treponema sp.]|nr:hypothetical protein [Treponema sp.]